MANNDNRVGVEAFPGPPGYRFVPSDESLILNYLVEKVLRGKSFDNIVECDVYADKSPWDLFEQHHHLISTYIRTGHLYVFTTLKKKTSKSVGGRNYIRVAGEGKWHGNTAGKPIFDHYNNMIGFKRQFKFIYKNRNRGEWIMHEYSLGENHPIVVCEIFQKNNPHNEESRLLELPQDIDLNNIFQNNSAAFTQQIQVDNNNSSQENFVGNKNIVDPPDFDTLFAQLGTRSFQDLLDSVN